MTFRSFRFFIPIVAVAAAALFGMAIITLTGRDPFMISGKLFRATLESGYGMGQVLFKTTTLIFTGLAVALPFKARLFNIGGEGQLLLAAFAAAITGSLLPPSFPPVAAIPLTALAAMTAGGLWGMSAGILKVRFGINEVISTIMMNFIAQAVTGYLLMYHFAVPSTEHTAQISSASMLPGLHDLPGVFSGSPANISLLAALGTAALSFVLLFRSRAGYELRAVGEMPEAAAYAGIGGNRYLIAVMGIAGAVAGLGAMNLVAGYKHCYETGMSAGIGFSGIAVALLAAAHPLWIVPAALFFGFLEYGGLAVGAYVPKDIFMIIQAITILLVIAGNARKPL
ncbi:MAG: ABC transporter permease [Chlorobium sp.]|uniref:ABC transporter permease n=1 Tax=Chlorobium sp. TaxID=1095 RepID=UPI0025BD43B9|nr:ABC transporter permease [Chlorobium sp.]MCF8215832.1 ABC transporter permease [Chlorobium sp.]MCF8270730.1 ABC transporter permease [Chlorobium sp.]MCF8287042.1 ABC transporter permease [Chlorobium sp.]MCF8290699.1 ABC transporter permease [Chlorobium sp.]MCF8384803.1 ABC transporter permease [Chlorobium sp.]